jgi:hypothetical protein
VLASEQLARRETNWDVKTYTKSVVELKYMVDQLLAQVTPLETQIGFLSGTILDYSTKLRAKEFSLECTTMVKDDLLHQNSRLTQKLEGNTSLLKPLDSFIPFSLLTPHAFCGC